MVAASSVVAIHQLAHGLAKGNRRERFRKNADIGFVKKNRLHLGEYWIIDEMEEAVTLLHLDKRGKFQEVRSKDGDGVFYSEVIEGFWLDPAWLWQSPRPRPRNAVLLQLNPISSS